MDPFVMAVNNIFLQYIEHVDAEGYSGNLTDILLFLESWENRDAYRDGTLSGENRDIPLLISNSPLKVLLVSPEHRDKVIPILKSLQEIKA